MSHSPEGLLDVPLLLQLAGDKIFAQGERYFSEGRVRQLHASADRVTGRVEGTRSYRVKLWKARGEFQFSCGCPAGVDHVFCQHCVAAGLAWIAAPGGGAPPDSAEPKNSPAGRPADAAQTREKLAVHLQTLGRERLVKLVLEASDYDDILRRRLLLEAAGVSRGSSSRAAAHASPPPDLDAYIRLLREAIETPDYVDYDAMPDYALGVQEAIAPLGGLLRDGYAPAVVELAEYALVELDKISDLLDGSDGSLNPVYDDLQRFHLEACRTAQPDPVQLAERLLRYEVEGGLGVFNNAVNAYADVLGERGAKAWRKRLAEEWSQLPAASTTGGHPGAIDHRRFQLRVLMERCAESTGDTAALVAIRERDLSSAHDYLSLAQSHAAHGQHEQAISRAEEGLRAFAMEDDAAGLRDFLIPAYERAGKTSEARALIWQAFLRVGDEAGYRRLREHFRRAAPDDWPIWRERAQTHLRAQVARETEAATRQGRSHRPDHSTLVEILLEEHRYDSAWREALAGGCRVDLWLQLAARREKKHPADALGVYQARLEPTIAGGGSAAYRDAIELLDKIRALLGRLGRGEDFAAYRAEIRAAHRQKRGFMKLLDAAER